MIEHDLTIKLVTSANHQKMDRHLPISNHRPLLSGGCFSPDCSASLSTFLAASRRYMAIRSEPLPEWGRVDLWRTHWGSEKSPILWWLSKWIVQDFEVELLGFLSVSSVPFPLRWRGLGSIQMVVRVASKPQLCCHLQAKILRVTVPSGLKASIRKHPKTASEVVEATSKTLAVRCCQWGMSNKKSGTFCGARTSPEPLGRRPGTARNFRRSGNLLGEL